MTIDFEPLTVENIKGLIGKGIEWVSEGKYKRYSGKTSIEQIDIKMSHPIIDRRIDGDSLSYAFIDDHGLEKVDSTYKVSMKSPRCFSYNGKNREVFFRLL